MQKQKVLSVINKVLVQETVLYLIFVLQQSVIWGGAGGGEARRLLNLKGVQ